MPAGTRKEYWDKNYLGYWKSRVDEASSPGMSRVVKGDPTTESDLIYEKIFAETPFNPGSLLDVGCAWGRMFDRFAQHGLRIHGIDISEAMIASARENWDGHGQVDGLKEAEAEEIPYPDAGFDNLTCLAVFDATFQHLALAEFMRVLRPGGLFYISGKNTRYFPDDQAAVDAEAGARGKGHPNFFTDVAAMFDQLSAHGHQIVSTRFFPRRGDFAKLDHVSEMPERFYEYLLIGRRGPNCRSFEPFASEFSATFREMENEA